MSFNSASGAKPTPPDQDEYAAYSSSIVGAAIFDLNGLPKEYFTTDEGSNMSWVQTIFQALGLRSLLMSSLQLEGFHHAVIQGPDCCAVVVKQPARYMALLIQQTEPGVMTDAFVQWVQRFEPNVLKTHPRFRAA
ncbi:MAG TPA: hypothetical protein V6D16_21540 [Candidatus Obscuribacterales bacterium]|jgi:hypothetical protein